MTTADMRDRYCLRKALIFWLRVLIALQTTNTVEDIILLNIYKMTISLRAAILCGDE